MSPPPPVLRIGEHPDGGRRGGWSRGDERARGRANWWEVEDAGDRAEVASESGDGTGNRAGGFRRAGWRSHKSTVPVE